jgi:hypothetical protein
LFKLKASATEVRLGALLIRQWRSDNFTGLTASNFFFDSMIPLTLGRKKKSTSAWVNQEKTKL